MLVFPVFQNGKTFEKKYEKIKMKKIEENLFN